MALIRGVNGLGQSGRTSTQSDGIERQPTMRSVPRAGRRGV